MKKMIAIILYCGLVNVSSLSPKLEHKDFVPWVEVTKYNDSRPIQATYRNASCCQSNSIQSNPGQIDKGEKLLGVFPG